MTIDNHSDTNESPDDITNQRQLIVYSGTHTLPGEVKSAIDDLPDIHVPPVRKFLFIKRYSAGVTRNVWVAIRAYRVLAIMTLCCWAISILLLIGSSVNYLLLEDINLFATSHDARIEQVSRPIKVGSVK